MRDVFSVWGSSGPISAAAAKAADKTPDTKHDTFFTQRCFEKARLKILFGEFAQRPGEGIRRWLLDQSGAGLTRIITQQ